MFQRVALKWFDKQKRSQLTGFDTRFLTTHFADGRTVQQFSVSNSTRERAHVWSACSCNLSTLLKTLFKQLNFVCKQLHQRKCCEQANHHHNRSNDRQYQQCVLHSARILRDQLSLRRTVGTSDSTADNFFFIHFYFLVIICHTRCQNTHTERPHMKSWIYFVNFAKRVDLTGWSSLQCGKETSTNNDVTCRAVPPTPDPPVNLGQISKFQETGGGGVDECLFTS